MATENVEISILSYDSSKEQVSFQVKSTHNGKRGSLMGSFHLSTPGDLPESEVIAQSKAGLRSLLRGIVDAI